MLPPTSDALVICREAQILTYSWHDWLEVNLATAVADGSHHRPSGRVVQSSWSPHSGVAGSDFLLK